MAIVKIVSTDILLKDRMNIVLTKADERILNGKDSCVTFGRGKCNDGSDPVYRLTIRPTKRLNLQKSRNQELNISKQNFCGLINGTEYKRSSYCPSITIVTHEWSVMMTFVNRNEDKRNKKFDSWRNALQKELKFGGYWPVQELKVDEKVFDTNVIGGTILCLTISNLAILTRNGHGLYVSRLIRDINTMVRSERHKAKNNEVQLLIIFSIDREYSRLAFKIRNDKSMTRDLLKILDDIKLPVIRRTSSYRRIPKGTEEQFPTVKQEYKDKLSRRISKDDLDIMLPPRPRKPKAFVHHLQTYDLNAISKKDEVLEAVHFYENSHFLSERNPAYVPMQRVLPGEKEEYWSIVSTLSAVLCRRTPTPDTLNLPRRLRQKLCFLLLDCALPCWKNLADYIDLSQEAVRMIETIFQSGLHLMNTDDPITPPECVLRHWQFVHNQHVDDPLSKKPPCPCSTASLISILTDMGRFELVLQLSQHVNL